MKKSSTGKSLFIFAAALGLFFSGCASLLGGGTKQDIQISSSPASASIKIVRDGVAGTTQVVYEGSTPATINLKRKDEYLVSLMLDGYQQMDIALEGETNGWVWGNIVCGGILGLIIDFTNGAAKKLVPGEISVQLVTAMGSNQEAATYAVISTMDSHGDLRLLPVPLIPDLDYVSR